MLDDTLPLTPPEWPEWGNPIESEKDFRTILSYSPYDNLAAKDYPAILAMGGLTDPRVTYWEPAKWIARLRATMIGRRPGAAAHQHGRRPRRRVGALQPARRSRDRLCVRAVGGGDGGEGEVESRPLREVTRLYVRRPRERGTHTAESICVAGVVDLRNNTACGMGPGSRFACPGRQWRVSVTARSSSATPRNPSASADRSPDTAPECCGRRGPAR